jgi:hypothetical protein
MAEVSLRVDDFENGVLPPMCASRGVTPARPRRLRASYQPTWPLVFVLLGPVGLLIAFVAMVGMTRHVDGWLPRSDEVVERGKRSRSAAFTAVCIVAATSLIGVLALMSVGARSPALLVGALGVVAVVAALWRAGHPRGHIPARLTANGRRVILRNIDQVFAAAYDEQSRWHRTSSDDFRV